MELVDSEEDLEAVRLCEVTSEHGRVCVRSHS